MRPEALEFLVCPEHMAGLVLAPEAVTEPGGHVMSGELRCRERECRYVIRDGVPILLPRDVPPLEAQTAARFADEWTHWNELRPYYERQFLGWVAPLDRGDFAGKLVFEGGCGKGRHTSVVAGFGARAVVSIDLGQSAFVAFANTRQIPNTHVAIGDLLRPPVRPEYDVGFSVGVIHHLPDPAAGFASLASRVREGGKVAVWVYGRENNEWITRYVDPVRRFLTSELEPVALRTLAAAPAAVLFGAMKLLYRPGPGGKGPNLPYGDYLASMHDFPFDEIHSIVFDQLVTPVAHYIPGDEVKGWFARGFSDANVRWHNRYSWAGVGTVRRTEPPPR